MMVKYTSPSPYPDSPEVRNLTSSPIPLLAPLPGLVSTGQPVPSSPIPLGVSAEEGHATAAHSHSKLAMDDGKIQNA